MPNSFRRFDSITQELNESLQELSETELNQAEKYEQSIVLCTGCLANLREMILADGFASEAEEIWFFKHVKPRVLARLFFFAYAAKLETEKLFYAGDALSAFLEARLAAIHAFAAEHIDFFHYYKTNSTHSDLLYFKRRSCDFRKSGIPEALLIDQDFSTFYDLRLGEILAKKELSKYLHHTLQELKTPGVKLTGAATPPIRWTASKAALTEMIYAFHAFGCFDNGDASLADIKTLFETTLNIPLTGFHKKGYEIRSRKGKATRFLDKLKAALDLNMLDYSDN